MRAPRGVVAILLAAFGVTAGRLNMSARIWTDPHVRPCWRHGQCTNAIAYRRIANVLSVNANVDEAVTAPPALDAGLIVAHIAESCRRRCGERTGIRRTIGPAASGRSKSANAAHEEPECAKASPSTIRTAFRS